MPSQIQLERAVWVRTSRVLPHHRLHFALQCPRARSGLQGRMLP
uniref:Uncharacterized protein n=1 Tax=Arundo donax TaxID=35708 RepID=A0A0A8ZD55_ARUDO